VARHFLKMGQHCRDLNDSKQSDHSPAKVNMAALMIGRLGYEVQTLLDPAAALELFRSAPQRFDLVISDMTMPRMTGPALFEKLREIRPDIPVILCTGHSAGIDQAKADPLGIDGFIMKPVGGRELGMAIRKALDGAKAGRSTERSQAFPPLDTLDSLAL
jgi:two-component system, cell cycle sensor histidine kinase and response regulator CckA